MFYPVESLRRGGRFYLCWVADSWPLRFATITHRQLWSQDIRQICDDLIEVMKNESGRSKNRFSLRLSSQLMRGLVRLYQRKVTVFVGDLCMINALVMKSTHKQNATNARPETTIRPELPRLVIEEQLDDKVEEHIQNSGNLVAHVQDITMKEPVLPENRMLLDDGFGELHPNQSLQMLVDRSVETMLVQETSAVHHSGIELPNISTDKSHDKSRLLPHETAQMEMISEHDMSVFRKSVGQELLPAADFEKEIPEIPDIPLPDLPAPETEKQKEQVFNNDSSSKPHDRNKNEKEKSLEEMVLEELEEEPQAKRRKLRSKLIIDKRTKLSSNFIRSRIENINVELRCEDSINDVIKVYATPTILLNRAAHCGASLRAGVGDALSHLFARNLGVVRRPPEDIEEIVAPRTRQSNMRSILEKIDEEVEPVDKRIESIQHEMQDVSKEINITDPNIIQEELVAPGQEIMDISDLPTQRILTTSQAQKTSDNGPPQKKPRRSGYTSYRLSQQAALEIPNIETNKENIPDFENRQQDAERLTAMLMEAGLADIQEQERQTDVETNQITQKSRRNGSETSETPLGSLDRTKVSLGDSEKTTDSKKFIRAEWGTQGTMHKIYAAARRGERPLDVRRVLARGPLPPGRRRLVAARCFTSVLKLKQHGFINIIKDPITNEIVDIVLGNKIIINNRQD